MRCAMGLRPLCDGNACNAGDKKKELVKNGTPSRWGRASVSWNVSIKLTIITLATASLHTRHSIHTNELREQQLLFLEERARLEGELKGARGLMWSKMMSYIIISPESGCVGGDCTFPLFLCCCFLVVALAGFLLGVNWDRGQQTCLPIGSG